MPSARVAPGGGGCQGPALQSALLLGLGLCSSSWGLAAAAAAEEKFLPPLEGLDLLERLKGIGAERSWPAFESDPSALAYAYGRQGDFPSPPGAFEENVRIVSESPRIMIIDDFLTEKECEFLRTYAKTRLEPALVVQSGDNWYDTQQSTRNNEQLWLTPKEEKSIPILRHLIKRMHRVARHPDTMAEALQIGRYNLSTKYEGHIDTDPPNKVARPSTLLMYLNDPEGGGETLFPSAGGGRRDDCNAKMHTHPETGEEIFGAKLCCETPERDPPEMVRVKPKMGRAVLFFSHLPDGEVDKRALHIACPVTKGEKWVAQRWFRFEPYNRIDYSYGSGWDARYDGPPAAPPAPGGPEGGGHLVRTLYHGEPRVFLAAGLLSAADCALLLDLAKAGSDEVALGWAEVGASAQLRDINGRLRQLARLPQKLDEPADRPVFVLRRLDRGSPEENHVDSDPPDSTHPVTVMVFLNDVEEGGELIFPAAPLLNKTGDDTEPRVSGAACPAGASLESCCATLGPTKVRPRRGDAVLLYSHTLEGELDLAAQHGRCAPRSGDSWVLERRFTFALKAAPPKVNGPAESWPQPRVSFENMLEATVKLFWVTPGTGVEVSMGEIGPFAKSDMNSFHRHVFHVRDQEGGLIQEVTVSAEPAQRVAIGEKAPEL